MQRGLYWCSVCGAVLLGLMGCQSTAPKSGLRIGSLMPITGDLASYGGAMQNAVRLLVDEVNACGGVLGESVALVMEDDQTDPTVGTAAMSKLTEVDGVAAVIGAASSAVTSATLPIATRTQVVQISPSSTSPVFTERAQAGEFDGFWFRTAPSDTAQGEALAQFAANKGFQRAAILAVNNDYGNGLGDRFAEEFVAQGGEVLKTVRFDPRGTTYESEVRQAFGTQPDVVVLIAYPETGSLILKAAFEFGVLEQAAVLLTDGLKDENLARLVGRKRSGEWIVAGLQGSAPHPEGPGFQDFRDRFFETYGSEPTTFTANSWDAAALVALAAEAAQDRTGTAVRDRLREVANEPGQAVTDVCEGLELLKQGEAINYQGASGTVDLDEHGDVSGSYDLWEIQADGAIKIMEPLMP